jgi:hypothetical protein
MPKGRRNLAIAFEVHHFTHFAGMAPVRAYCERLVLKGLLQEVLRRAGQCREYQPAETPGEFLHRSWDLTCWRWPAPSSRGSIAILQYNRSFQPIVPLPLVPDQTALRHFFMRLAPHHIRMLVRLHDQLRQALFD